MSQNIKLIGGPFDGETTERPKVLLIGQQLIVRSLDQTCSYIYAGDDVAKWEPMKLKHRAKK